MGHLSLNEYIGWPDTLEEKEGVKPWADLELTDVRLNQFREEYLAYAAREVTQNPTKVDKLFWKYMVARGCQAYDSYRELGLGSDKKGPVWCFDRFGMTTTKLPDGRLVCIAGEHEDFYDPDFFIYNDVIIIHPPQIDSANDLEETRAAGPSTDEAIADPQSPAISTGETTDEVYGDHLLPDALRTVPKEEDIEIYGYPTEVFPPTDFHTATYYKDGGGKEYIYIIGGLGYKGDVHYEESLVHVLDLEDFSIKQLKVTGDLPPNANDLNTVKEREAELQGDTILLTLVDKSCYRLSIPELKWTKV